MTEAAFQDRKRIRMNSGAYREGRAFLLTITTYHRHPWFQRWPDLTARASAVLEDLCVSRGSLLYAWCFMPDHLHLLLVDLDVVEWVRLFKGRVVPVARALEPSRRLWQRSFHDHALRAEESLKHAFHYVLENPVRAGLVARSPEYPWSGSREWPAWREWWDQRS